LSLRTRGNFWMWSRSRPSKSFSFVMICNSFRYIHRFSACLLL